MNPADEFDRMAEQALELRKEFEEATAGLRSGITGTAIYREQLEAGLVTLKQYWERGEVILRNVEAMHAQGTALLTDIRNAEFAISEMLPNCDDALQSLEQREQNLRAQAIEYRRSADQ